MGSIGQRIKDLRKSNNLTQKEFAKIINLSQGRLSELEQNKTKPSSDTLISICQHFKISINWLLTGENIEVPNRKATEAEADKFTNDIIDLYVKNGRIKEGEILTEEKREQILKEIQSIIDLANKLKDF